MHFLAPLWLLEESRGQPEASSRPMSSGACWDLGGAWHPRGYVKSKENLEREVGERALGLLSFLVKTMTGTNQHDLPGQETHWASFWQTSFCLESLSDSCRMKNRKRPVMTPVLFPPSVTSASSPAERPGLILWLSVPSAVNEASSDIFMPDSGSHLRHPWSFPASDPTLGEPWSRQVC